MKDITKMMIFMFLGLVTAILVLGFHKSGSGVSTATIATQATTTSSTSPSLPRTAESVGTYGMETAY